MKKLLFFFFLLIGSTCFGTEYKPISDYAGLVYNVLYSYLQHHDDVKPYDLRVYLHSKATNIIFNDALKMGYPKYRVIKCAYALSLQADPHKEVIVCAFCDDLKSYNMWKDVTYWACVGCSSFSTLTVIPLLFLTSKMYKEYLRT